MGKILPTDRIVAAIAATMIDSVIWYFPEKEESFVYVLNEKELELMSEFQDAKNVLYQFVEKTSHPVISQMFEAVDCRKATDSYDVQMTSGFWGEEKGGWINMTLNYQEIDDSYFFFVRKIDDRISEKQKLYEEVRKDPLTKLINKTYSVQVIKEMMERSRKGTLFIIDVDNFKSVNDTMGHLFGDEVIVSVANGIKSIFRNEDLVGRIGGDEFIVYIENLIDKEVIRKKAEMVCNTIAAIYTGESDTVKISASVGIALAPEQSTDYSELFQMADHALYYTKNKGKNGYTFFDKENEEMQKHHRIQMPRAGELEEAEEIDEEMEQFYFELNELAFRLLEETKESESAIKLMLHRIQDKFDLSVIRIWEPIQNTKGLQCVYELCDENSTSLLGKTAEYSEGEWIFLNNLCNSEPYVYAASVQSKEESKIFKSPEMIKSGVCVAISNNNCFAGAVTFIDHVTERRFSKTELKVLKSFERMYVVYRTKKISAQDKDFYLRQMAERDSLTGMYKYYSFLERLEEALYSVDSSSKLLYIHSDIAHFKYINESYGYDMGDRLLKEFARLISNCSKYLWFATRIHSDNIVAVYKYPADHEDEKVISHVNQKLEESVELLKKVVPSEQIMINCGVFIADGQNHKFTQSITNANNAKKLAKERADGKCVWYDAKMLEKDKKQVRFLEEFSISLKLHEFVVHFQPIVDTISQIVVGAEALVRWIKEDGTIFMPEEFCEVLDKAGKMPELDFYVIEEVCKYIKTQRDEQKRIVPISINLCEGQLKNPQFFSNLEKLLDKYQVLPNDLHFEIKEEVFSSKIESAIPFCDHLNRMGIQVVMDTFCLGYSSLNVLDKLPVCLVKLDRMFVKNNVFNAKEEAILSGIINIAKKLQILVASVGVETHEQNSFLSNCGCDMIQGNYYSAPLPYELFSKYLAEHAVPEVEETHFSFDGTLESECGNYKGYINGVGVRFNADILPGRQVLEFPGGEIAHEMIEFSLASLFVHDFSVSLWFYERKPHLWTSVFYADFNNAMLSIIPEGWDGVTSILRVMDKQGPDTYFDALGDAEKVSGWTHVVGVYNAQTRSLALFVNGLLKGFRDNVPKLERPGRVVLGGDIYQKSFNGYVGDLKVMNKSMSANDVREIFEREKIEYLTEENEDKRRYDG